MSAAKRHPSAYFTAMQTPKRPDAGEAEREDVQEARRPDAREAERLNVQTPGRRTKHTIYLPPQIARQVKHRAIDEGREMSEIVEEALRRYFETTP